MRGHVTAPPFPLSDRASDVRPGCKTQKIALTLRQVAVLMCARIKEREYFKTCIVGHVNCCLQCGPTLTLTTPGLGLDSTATDTGVKGGHEDRRSVHSNLSRFRSEAPGFKYHQRYLAEVCGVVESELSLKRVGAVRRWFALPSAPSQTETKRLSSAKK
ncbi:hypothetical protein PoB_005379700 [Plakobranchus ocellatus]|uniref:Uncharacterized protein n=1 Tax=Plakobranchus ocellatus TaxID=259542 RepID=A0AAV4C7D7_9GAST|nr:hypothetical protein PoB_005379700 [Plakobranchus ocellatus]